MSAIQPIYRQIGAKMEQMRNALGWTQADLAKKTGWSRPSIVNIEAGRQRILLHDIERLASAFGVSPKHFLRGIWL